MNLGGNHRLNGVISPYSVVFVFIHLGCFAVIWTGLSSRAMVLGLALYVVRIFAIGAGYHRYFAHRAFRTSRAFQFGLALLSLTSAQRGILWWAAKHRQHHMHSDTDADLHSPVRRSFLYAHVGWIFLLRNDATDSIGGAGFLNVADRRLAGTGNRLLLEHGGSVACDVQHQLAVPPGRPSALHDR
jgi:stearoyl-CoA desaturase (delta-9 desaturase)